MPFGGVAGCIARVLSRSTWMRNHRGLSVMNGESVLNNNLCLQSCICRWVRPAGANGISSIGHVEAFVAQESSLIVRNGFARGVCYCEDF